MTAQPPARGWVEIDQNALAHNIRMIRAELGAHVELCAVVKADAYGHGIDIVAPELSAQQVGAIGVASNDDAEAVRATGFDGRLIRVRPASREEVEDGIRLRIEEWVGGLEHAAIIADAAFGRQAVVPVHISLNSTGLSRDGIDLRTPGAFDDLASFLRAPGVHIVGAASHFPCEDEDDVREGSVRFDQDSRLLRTALPSRSGAPFQRHCATTFAALHVPESRFDLARIGAGIYGDTPALGGTLRPAMRLLSTVTAVNAYPKGSTVGYDRWHTADRDARFAFVPLGYADGMHRSLSGTGEVLIRGMRARIVDRIAMNGFLVDVSHIDGAAPGDVVVLYGAQGGQSITSDDLAASHTNIAADLYVAWGRLLPRRAVGAGR